MKSILTKSLVLLLVASMLVIGFVSCGGPVVTTKTPTTTTEAVGDGDTEPERDSSYPTQLEGMKSKTDGKTIKFAYVEAGNGTYVADSLWIDETTGLELDDVEKAVVNRNAKLKEELGVDISAINYSPNSISGLQSATKDLLDNQTTEIDVYCGYQYYDISLAKNGYLIDLTSDALTNDAGEQLINIEKGYWATNYIDSITYNDNVYWVTGDIALLYSGGLYCTYVNTQLYDQYVKQSYENKSIYQIVYEGKWTMDAMIAMAQKAANPGEDGKLREGEVAGFLYENCDEWEGLAFGCQVEFGKKTVVNGVESIEITLGTNPKAKTFANYCKELYASENITLHRTAADSANIMPYFAEGKSLFVVNKLYQSAIYLTEMENFAIIPTPKLNEAQKSYASGTHDSLTIFGITKCSTNKEAAAATLELMAFYSADLVTPVFYEKYILGSRTVREDESMDMIKLIRKGFDSDFVAAWSNSIDNIVHFFRTSSNVANFTYNTQQKRTLWPKKLGDLLTALDEAALTE